ncbi:hypothetical protein [Cereibacter ovatus]|nr:hypothetical protein [Cereibacter ovatus]
MPGDLRTSPKIPGCARLFLVQQAVYEISHDLGSRPEWVTIPLRCPLDLLAIASE